ncbi:MAG: YicC family protein [Gammaproteobacteria bacterium]|nr:YicC family protein [Gammaproteobacteria bacterium]
MISSMTGFARRQAGGDFGNLTCELRSVNHRYLEPGFRLPEELRSIESELRQTLARELRRGKLDCTIHLRGSHQAELGLRIDKPGLEKLLERTGEIAKLVPNHIGIGLSIASRIELLDVLRWPGVLKDDPPDSESLQGACRKLFLDTVRDLATARKREGQRLHELIERRCADLAALVRGLRSRMPELRERLRTRLQERITELGVTVDAARFEQELVLLLQRADVDEELDRLEGHVAEIRRVIDTDDAAGRRLDFLMQELNREANTLSSKSQELELTRIAVDMKVLIEQMREQVQNIE